MRFKEVTVGLRFLNTLIKPHELFVLLCVILLLIFGVEVLMDDLLSGKVKTAEILISSLITTLLITTILNFKQRHILWQRTRKYDGVWGVLKFKNDSYQIQNEYVELQSLDDDLLIIKYTSHDRTGNITIGALYMEEDNKFFGKLVMQVDTMNQVSGQNPVRIFDYFFDVDKKITNNNNGLIIRVLEKSGNETKILFKADNPEEYKKVIDGLFEEYIFNTGGKTTLIIGRNENDQLIKP